MPTHYYSVDTMVDPFDIEPAEMCLRLTEGCSVEHHGGDESCETW